MEYIFGSVRVDGEECDNVKTVGSEHSELSGKMSITRKYTDSHITDNFTVLEKYRSEEADGLCYDWYVIKDHYRYEDRFTPGICATEQEITDIEIENMEQEQAITDAEIDILELKEQIGG